MCLLCCVCVCVQGKYILTPGPITYAEEQLLHFLGQLLGIGIRADLPLPLDLLSSFWKVLVGESLDPEADLHEADVLTHNYIKRVENVRAVSALTRLLQTGHVTKLSRKVTGAYETVGIMQWREIKS